LPDPAGLHQGVCEPVGGEGAWDLRIFVSTALEKTVDRAVIRERRVSCPVEVERRWRERYVPSEQLCFATVRPTDHANIIVHNDEPQQPVRETQTH
jgi:uridine kinase